MLTFIGVVLVHFICSAFFQPQCKRLWCGNDTEGCRTQHMPWADGTPCSLNGSPRGWCQRGECVYRNPSALAKVDGGWDRWSANSTCSRTCGGGVRFRMRDCNNPSPANGGKYCIGQRIQYFSCNTQDCQPHLLDFREEQCASFNRLPLGIDGHGDTDNVTWVPKYGGKYGGANFLIRCFYCVLESLIYHISRILASYLIYITCVRVYSITGR